MAGTLYIDNDNDIYIRGFRKRSTGEYKNDATFTFTAYGVADDAISNATAVSMTYVAGSNGNYSGVCPGTLLTVGNDVTVVAQASNYNVKLTKVFKVAQRNG